MRKLVRSLRLRPATGAVCRPVWRVGLACAGLGIVGAWLGGCAAKEPVAALAPESAEFVIVNLSDRAWEIALTATDGAARRWRVEPWATRREAVRAGNYRGEQVLLTADGEKAASRELTILLDGGKSYRWRLATLQTDKAGRKAGRPEGEEAVR